MSARRLLMVIYLSRQCVSTAALSVGVGALLAAAAHIKAMAADASAWDGDNRSAVRLIAGGRRDDAGALRAGVDIRLADGWKTYWRYPGDSGVPPVFDFSKSVNVTSVTVSWPAPHRFTDESGTSIGYKSDVLFPVHVVPKDPRRPVTLKLALDYAVCEKLCVPAHAGAVLEMAAADAPTAPSAQDSRLDTAQKRTPRPARLGEAAPLSLTAVRREAGAPHPRIVVEVNAPAEGVDLFAEGPAPEWSLPVPEPISGAPQGRRWFAFDLDGVPPGVDPTGAALRFTLVSGDNAVEVTAVPK